MRNKQTKHISVDFELGKKDLSSSIKTAMKQVIADGNKTLIVGIQETVKLKLAEIAVQMKPKVTI
jgi:hypothetical protein